jgi:hypothetical protein
MASNGIMEAQVVSIQRFMDSNRCPDNLKDDMKIFLGRTRKNNRTGTSVVHDVRLALHLCDALTRVTSGPSQCNIGTRDVYMKTTPSYAPGSASVLGDASSATPLSDMDVDVKEAASILAEIASSTLSHFCSEQHQILANDARTLDTLRSGLFDLLRQPEYLSSQQVALQARVLETISSTCKDSGIRPAEQGALLAGIVQHQHLAIPVLLAAEAAIDACRGTADHDASAKATMSLLRALHLRTRSSSDVIMQQQALGAVASRLLHRFQTSCELVSAVLLQPEALDLVGDVLTVSGPAGPVMYGGAIYACPHVM